MSLHTCKTHMQTNTCLRSNVIVYVVFAHANARAYKSVETPKIFFLPCPLFIYMHISRCGVATMSKPPNCQVSLAGEPRKNRGCWEKSWNTLGAYQSIEIKCNHVCFIWTWHAHALKSVDTYMPLHPAHAHIYSVYLIVIFQVLIYISCYGMATMSMLPKCAVLWAKKPWNNRLSWPKSSCLSSPEWRMLILVLNFTTGRANIRTAHGL